MADNSKEEMGISSDSQASEPHSIFTPVQKRIIVTIVAIAATFSAFSSNIYFPAIPSIAENLRVTPESVNLTVTSYLVLQGLSPSVWGAIADVHGRRVTYIITFVIYLGACIGLAETKHFYQLVILRCLQSTGSASTIAIGAGVVGDITTREDRGGYMGIYQAGLLCPLAIGPVLGGVFSQTLGWRAIFWFLTIYSGIVLFVLFFFLP
jgi:MFS family permease